MQALSETVWSQGAAGLRASAFRAAAKPATLIAVSHVCLAALLIMLFAITEQRSSAAERQGAAERLARELASRTAPALGFGMTDAVSAILRESAREADPPPMALALVDAQGTVVAQESRAPTLAPALIDLARDARVGASPQIEAAARRLATPILGDPQGVAIGAVAVEWAAPTVWEGARRLSPLLAPAAMLLLLVAGGTCYGVGRLLRAQQPEARGAPSAASDGTTGAFGETTRVAPSPLMTALSNLTEPAALIDADNAIVQASDPFRRLVAAVPEVADGECDGADLTTLPPALLPDPAETLAGTGAPIDVANQAWDAISLPTAPDSEGRVFRLVVWRRADPVATQAPEADDRGVSSRMAMMEDLVAMLSEAMNLPSGQEGADDAPCNPQDLEVAFKAALDRQRDGIDSVIGSAEQLGGEAATITSMAEDLSRRTETQAATLEQTSAALDELTTSAKSAAEFAREASDMASAAKLTAESGDSVVKQTIGAMGAIEQSTSEISKTISVIEDIAFQTNLLALNAGVEAARAGDAGRGFAVVASEVRALAQRSTEAAQAIYALISTSEAQVKQGVGLVDEMGVSLRDIVKSATDIAQHVSGIADAVHEQSSSLEEINAAVTQLDQVTQQNAAMFQETTAAGQAMDQSLRTLVAAAREIRFASATPAD